MKPWCRIDWGGRPHYAELQGEMLTILDGCPLEGGKPTATNVARSEARLLEPVVPPNFYAAGLNFRDHIDWANREFNKSMGVPSQADIGQRSVAALTGHDSDIIVPADAKGPLHFEGELVAVIGRRAKHLSETEALSCVAGYTLGNDVSERNWQFDDRTMWRGKNTDTFKPMGPVVVSGIDPMNQDIEVRINGKTASVYNTSKMVFSVAHYVSRMSQYVTLHPGDVIWFGCDGPTVPALKDGDVVEVICSAIGTLRNRIRWLG
jgi:2-keto-4-pentenoate hydratase/2-oxohepta-3-ene-1,7-dioic acid hydratase in catechol pathway